MRVFCWFTVKVISCSWCRIKQLFILRFFLADLSQKKRAFLHGIKIYYSIPTEHGDRLYLLVFCGFLMCLETCVFTAGFFWAFKAVKMSFFAVVLFWGFNGAQYTFLTVVFILSCKQWNTLLYCAGHWRIFLLGFLLLCRPLVWSGALVIWWRR